jgi:hypothetical protein
MDIYGEFNYSFNILNLRHSMEVSGELHTAAALSTENCSLDGPTVQLLGTVRREKSYHAGNKTRAVQPEACRFTD